MANLALQLQKGDDQRPGKHICKHPLAVMIFERIPRNYHFLFGNSTQVFKFRKKRDYLVHEATMI